VTFDWDSSIRRISDKIAEKRRSRPVSRGLPNIALREMELERQKAQSRHLRVRESDDSQEHVVLPLRKNEMPNIRKDLSGLLKAPRFAMLLK
jgi:hypothetical protein